MTYVSQGLWKSSHESCAWHSAHILSGVCSAFFGMHKHLHKPWGGSVCFAIPMLRQRISAHMDMYYLATVARQGHVHDTTIFGFSQWYFHAKKSCVPHCSRSEVTSCRCCVCVCSVFVLFLARILNSESFTPSCLPKAHLAATPMSEINLYEVFCKAVLRCSDFWSHCEVMKAYDADIWLDVAQILPVPSAIVRTSDHHNRHTVLFQSMRYKYLAAM